MGQGSTDREILPRYFASVNQHKDPKSFSRQLQHIVSGKR